MGFSSPTCHPHVAHITLAIFPSAALTPGVDHDPFSLPTLDGFSASSSSPLDTGTLTLAQAAGHSLITGTWGYLSTQVFAAATLTFNIHALALAPNAMAGVLDTHAIARDSRSSCPTGKKLQINWTATAKNWTFSCSWSPGFP